MSLLLLHGGEITTNFLGSVQEVVKMVRYDDGRLKKQLLLNFSWQRRKQ